MSDERDPRPFAPGDVGRRVAHRRQELGLSRAQAARRADLHESYLEYVEEHAAHVSPGAMLRLADALGTTAAELLGGSAEVPPGRRSPIGRAPLEPMDDAECRRLLALGGVGRFVFSGPDGPVAVPVNYRVLDGDVVFRTEDDTTIAAAGGGGAAVSFEVDRIDDAMSAGWSVLATGHARRVEHPGELEVLRATGVEPWAAGSRDLYLRLTPERISGRRIRPVG